MSDLINELVTANHILANEGVIDAYGHISVRDPEDPSRFFLSRSRSPQFVQAEDILTFDLDGEKIGDDDKPPYLERFIHAGVYAANSEAKCVIHAHSLPVLPFSIIQPTLRAVIHDAHDTGEAVPIWDIRDDFGTATDHLVRNIEMGHSIARAFTDDSRFVLMRGHGFASYSDSIQTAVRAAIYFVKNAQVLTTALQLGEPINLTAGEINARRTGKDFVPTSSAMSRSWHYWESRLG